MFLYVIIVLPLAVYLFVRWRYNYWQTRGVYTIEPTFPVGSLGEVKSGRILPFEFYQKFYNDVKQKGLKYGGLYEGLTPVFVPVDQDLIKSILLKDFNHFVDHGLYSNPKADPLTGGLFLLEGEPWKMHRAKLTPTFTTGKMKMMFETFKVCSKGLEKLLAKEASTGDPIFIKEVMARFTTDIIGSVAFGLDCNCMNEPDNEFRVNCDKAFGINGKLKVFLYRFFPKWFLKAINYKQNDPVVEKFFFNLVESTIKYREENNVTRKDFLQMLIELNTTGTLSDGETVSAYKNNITNKEAPFFTLNDIVAHSFTFFLAGFETSSTTMSFAICELGLNQDVQDRLRDEIWRVLDKYNEELTYEAVNEMTYLDHVIQETLRKYPPIPILPRICTKRYKLPNEDLVIEKGTKVNISIQGVHRDPEFYPDPDKFIPERWSIENAANRSNFNFLTFGEGPRICIGLRFGKLQAKCGIITLIKDYKLSLSDKMQVPIKCTPRFIIGVQGGVWVNLEKINRGKMQK